MHHFSRQVEAAWNFRFVTWPIFVIIAEILLWLRYKKNQSGATKSVAPAHSLPPCRFTHLFAAPSAPKIAVLSATSPRSSPGMGSCVSATWRENFRCATPPHRAPAWTPAWRNCGVLSATRLAIQGMTFGETLRRGGKFPGASGGPMQKWLILRCQFNAFIIKPSTQILRNHLV